MKIIAVKSLAIPDIRVVRFARFRDERGYFTESYRTSDFRGHPQTGFLRNATFLQGNESYSDRGVIRGLHFQWNPLMGDGRAVLVGEIEAPDGTSYDVHLKGSGPTVYARRGDGRATLPAMLREYVVSEAMAGLKIPTTRSLAVVATQKGYVATPRPETKRHANRNAP